MTPQSPPDMLWGLGAGGTMVMHTMRGKVMIYLSSRMHELRVRSRDAITTDMLRTALASGNHPKEPTRAVSEHASTCRRLQWVLAASCWTSLPAAHAVTVTMMIAGGDCATLHMAGAGLRIVAWPGRTRQAKTAPN